MGYPYHLRVRVKPFTLKHVKPLLSAVQISNMKDLRASRDSRDCDLQLYKTWSNFVLYRIETAPLEADLAEREREVRARSQCFAKCLLNLIGPPIISSNSLIGSPMSLQALPALFRG